MSQAKYTPYVLIQSDRFLPLPGQALKDDIRTPEGLYFQHITFWRLFVLAVNMLISNQMLHISNAGELWAIITFIGLCFFEVGLMVALEKLIPWKSYYSFLQTNGQQVQIVTPAGPVMFSIDHIEQVVVLYPPYQTGLIINSACYQFIMQDGSHIQVKNRFKNETVLKTFRKYRIPVDLQYSFMEC